MSSDIVGGRPVLIMVAPTGARRTTADHPALPVTAEAIVACAEACVAAGAGALHAHVRDAEQRHLLDAAAYRDLLERLAARLPDLPVQVTTESAGLYGPDQQADLLATLRPRFVSIAVREFFARDEGTAASALQAAHATGARPQWILYDEHDVDWFADLAGRGLLPGTEPHRVIHVFGRYTAGQESAVSEVDVRLAQMRRLGHDDSTVWMVCAFGRGETAVLEAAMAAGGHARVGFENSLLHPDGRVAADNAERVAVVAAAAHRLGRPLATRDQAAAILGGP